MLMLIKTANHRDSLEQSAQNILHIKGTYTFTYACKLHLYVLLHLHHISTVNKMTKYTTEAHCVHEDRSPVWAVNIGILRY